MSYDKIIFEGKTVPASYLGDGVYAIFDGYGVWLHANDHKYPTDKIYLEPKILAALNNFVNKDVPNFVKNFIDKEKE